MNKPRKICAITLAGFQVFEKPTRIPLERLTLLFGPNSAGKSAVQDALDIIALMESKPSPTSGASTALNSLMAVLQSGPSQALTSLLDRHWRRPLDPSEELDQRMEIRIEYSTDSEEDSGYYLAHRLWSLIETEDFEESKYPPGFPLSIEKRWTFLGSRNEVNELSFFSDFELLLESETILKFQESRENALSLNVDHAALSQVKREFNFTPGAADPDYFMHADGTVTLRNVAYFDSSGAAVDEKGERWLFWTGSRHDKQGKQTSSADFLKVIPKLFSVTGTILDWADHRASFEPRTVEASRQVPSQSSLTFLVGEFYGPLQSMLKDGDPQYRRLADSLTVDLTTMGYADPKKISEAGRKFANKVNHALADHLFIERGYRVDFDYQVVLSRDQMQDVKDGVDLEQKRLGYVVELFLRDVFGVRHYFSDVGSGIGYVLPVLCTVCDDEDHICFLQQPELHLHPALQAAMADVFIQSFVRGKQIVVETHSEHLLLRALKRVRQTHVGTPIAQELHLDADDLSVLYFNPLSDGTTEVKRLRVTPDGDFMDRWPRGFFAERDAELFDDE